MSKADQLGHGAAFGKARTARSSRSAAFQTALNGGDPNVAAVTDLAVTLISENPDNPRNHLRNLDEMVETVSEVGVILPIVVASVDAYLKERPDRADDLDDDCHYVVVDGHRRLEAARRVGLATIPVRVDNARVATDEALLEAAFVANYHRDDMTDLEEAHALKQLVDYYGSQTKASKRLGIPQNTISSKLSLLKLSPELQRDLVDGVRKVEHVRNLGKLSPEEQKAKADERAEAARGKADRSVEAVPERSAGPAEYHGVIVPKHAEAAQPLSAKADEQRLPAPSPIATVPRPGSVPEPREVAAREDSSEPSAPRRFPYEDGMLAAQHLIRKMPDEEFNKMLDACLEHRSKQSATAS